MSDSTSLDSGSLPDLLEAADGLRPRVTSAANGLDQAAKRLHEGLPADIGDIIEAQTVTQDLLRLFAAGRKAGVPLDEAPSLTSVHAALREAIAAACSDTILDTARATLASVARLRHATDGVPPALTAVHDAARAVLKDMEAPAGTLRPDDVVPKVKPFEVLLRLVRQDAPVAEGDYAEALPLLTQAFGAAILPAVLARVLTIVDEPPAVAAPAGTAGDAPVAAAPHADVAADGHDSQPLAAPREPADSRPSSTLAETEAQALTPPIDQAVPATAGHRAPPEAPPGDRQPDRDVVPQHEVCDAVWSLVAAGRTGLAAALANAAGIAGLPDLAELAALLRATALAPHVWGRIPLPAPAADAQAELTATYTEALDGAAKAIGENDLPPDEKTARRLLGFAACLRPALLAPHSGVTGILACLDYIEASAPSFGPIRDALRTFCAEQVELDPMLLKGVRDHARWQEDLADFERQCEDWLRLQRSANLNFKAATDVWRKWLEDNAPLGRAMRSIINRQVDRASRERIAATLDKWSRQRDIDHAIEHDDHQLRSNAANTRPIEGSARTDLHKRVEAWRTKITAWLNILESEPAKLDNRAERAANHVREAVLGNLASARDQLGQLESTRPLSPRVQAACRRLAAAIADVASIMDRDASAPAVVPTCRYLLNHELLGDPALHLDESWSLVSVGADEAVSTVRRMLAIADTPVAIREAFDRACAARNHVRTQQIIESLAEGGQSSLRGDFVARRAVAMEAAAAWIAEAKGRALTAIERAVCHRLISSDRRSEMQARVDAPLETMLDFAALKRVFDDVEREIRDLENRRAGEVRAEYEQLVAARLPGLTRSARDQIESALRLNDYPSALEYMEFVRQGRPLTEVLPSHASVFRDFFLQAPETGTPSFTSAYARAVHTHSLRDLIDAMRQRTAMPPIDFADVSEDEAEAAAQVAESWLRLKGERRNAGHIAADLAKVLAGLGFKAVEVGEVSIDSVDNCWKVNVTTNPIADRQTCTVPHFGSQAAGRYKVLGVHGPLDEERFEELTRASRGYRETDAILVLQFGFIDDDTRRGLGSVNWKERRGSLVIDDAVLFFACGSRSNRLARLFECCVPFVFVEPYRTTASLVPVEMFFGRDRERSDIMSPTGACLVYGGRQLGKSALLKDIERRHHDAAAGRIVRTICLKAAGVTRATDIWGVIAQALHDLKVLQKRVSSAEGIAKHVKDWLQADAGRTILLLLDEADAFLVADGKAEDSTTHHCFPELSRLKGLMDDTNRRFKCVFAGLHNVQRTARDPNSPIHHLGEQGAICIGPLLENDEWQQARDLILTPFGEMGFALDPPELWMRIASYTNYYPSLIQVFCKHLLEYLHTERKYDPRTSPPYPITLEDVERAFQLERMQEEIRFKFEMTLDLDRRYRLIALQIALACLESPDTRFNGVSVSWVRTECLKLWPQGFPAGEQGHELFRTLLFEMRGLGIVREVESDRYTLRSPNVLTLLGDQERIMDGIYDISEKPAAATYFNGMTRRPLGGDVWLRSPFTADQEAFLSRMQHGVLVCQGCHLSGIDRVREGVEAIPGLVAVCAAERLTQIGQFNEWLAGHIGSRSNKPDGVVLLLIPPECDWNAQWLALARTSLERKKSDKKLIRAMFVADAPRTWEVTDPDVANEKLNLLSLGPWHDSFFGYWSDHVGLPNTAPFIDQVKTATGGWPLLMEQFGERCRHRAQAWQQILEDILTGLNVDSLAADLKGCRDGWSTLQAIAELGTIPPGLLGSLDDLVGPFGNRTADWATRLGLTVRSGDGMSVDPTIQELLGATAPA